MGIPYGFPSHLLLSYIFPFSCGSRGSQGKNSGVVCHSLFQNVDHILSELSTMTHPPWLALHSMAHSFIELYNLYNPLRYDKAVIHEGGRIL